MNTTECDIDSLKHSFQALAKLNKYFRLFLWISLQELFYLLSRKWIYSFFSSVYFGLLPTLRSFSIKTHNGFSTTFYTSCPFSVLFQFFFLWLKEGLIYSSGRGDSFNQNFEKQERIIWRIGRCFRKKRVERGKHYENGKNVFKTLY